MPAGSLRMGPLVGLELTTRTESGAGRLIGGPSDWSSGLNWSVTARRVQAIEVRPGDEVTLSI